MEYIYQVGNANELNSTIRNGLIPGGKSLKRGRQAVFFTKVNPMEDGNGMGETPCDLTEPRIAPYKNTWKLLQNSVFWCNLKLAQEKGLQFYQTRPHAVVLFITLSAACIEKAVCMKTQDQLYQKVRLTPRVPRVVLKSNSQYGLQDPHAKTQDHVRNHRAIRKVTVKSITTPWITEYLEYLFLQSSRIQTRENNVKKLVEKFENHQHKESFIQDLRQTQKINKFSKESQDLIADINNAEIFELWEIFPNSNVVTAMPTGE